MRELVCSSWSTGPCMLFQSAETGSILDITEQELPYKEVSDLSVCVAPLWQEAFPSLLKAVMLS